MISELLSQCGLNKSEQTVLIYLLERGRRAAGHISKRTGIKRPTVYAALEALVTRDLVHKQKQDGVTYFSPARADFIPAILEGQAKQHFNSVKDAANLMKPFLEKIRGQHVADFAGYEISTLGSAEAVWSQLEQVFLEGDFCAIFNPEVTLKSEHGQELVKRVLDKTAKTRAIIRELAVAGPNTDWYRSLISNPNHQLRVLPAGTEIISDMIFINGSVVLSHYGSDQELGIRITQRDFYVSMLAMFELLWQQAGEP